MTGDQTNGCLGIESSEGIDEFLTEVYPMILIGEVEGLRDQPKEVFFAERGH